MRIVFFGSDDFSNSILLELIDSGFKPILVLTAPDKPKGRGKKLLPTDVKKTALDNDIKVLTPEKITSEVVKKIGSLNPDIFVTISYGLFLPTKLLKLVEYPLNIHPSLLPKYRGASPIRSVLLNGDFETGVSIMKMIRKMDAGDIFLQKKLPVEKKDDYLSLKPRLIELAKTMIIELLDSIASGKVIKSFPQEGEPVYCSKFTKSDLKIDWNNSATRIINKIRAFSDMGVFTFLNGQRVKIYSAEMTDKNLPVSKIKIEKKSILVGTSDKAIKILKLQFPGKKPMRAIDAVNGGKFRDVETFDNG